VWIGNWRFAQQENAQGQRYQASVRGEDFAYDLALDAATRPCSTASRASAARQPTRATPVSTTAGRNWR
jgi:predicted secreted hydrolase